LKECNEHVWKIEDYSWEEFEPDEEDDEEDDENNKKNDDDN
jgi:hypothetical protein